MAKKTKKTNKKEAEVPEGTKKLNNLVKKQKKEQEQEEIKPTPKAPKVTVDMLLEKLPDVEINKRKDGFVKFIKGDCYVMDMFYGIQVSENFHGTPRKVIGRIENQKDLDKWMNTIK
ncbi:MAG: hypothetical protein KAJ69_00775 [Thermoplasmatales archaeon]|nr:hypothetical protein [Thermoplasmatales archaeon]